MLLRSKWPKGVISLCIVIAIATCGIHQCDAEVSPSGKVPDLNQEKLADKLSEAAKVLGEKKPNTEAFKEAMEKLKKANANKAPIRGAKERKKAEMAARQKYVEMKQKGVNSVSNTKESQLMREYEMRKRKRKGFILKRETSLSSVLFPGVSPVEYENGERLPIFAELVESRKTQVPYKFYSKNIPFCPKPDSTTMKRAKRKSLGAKLQGTHTELSPYYLTTQESTSCTPLCTVPVKANSKQMRSLKNLIIRQYRVHLTLDTLPVLVKNPELNYVVRGYPVGFTTPPASGNGMPDIHLYNHLDFTISYSQDPDEFTGVRITGFDVHPVSIQHEGSIPDVSTCNTNNPPRNDPSNFMTLTDEDTDITYSYSVKWLESEVEWSDRWDIYLLGGVSTDAIYLSMTNSLIMTFFLAALVATIMIRTLRKDIALYNDLDITIDDDEQQEETGWKLVHGDVFRPPSTSPLLLSVAVGTGAQIGTSLFVTVILAMLKIINPMNKGSMLTAIIFLYVLSGSVAGYISARLYKFCDATAWKLNTIITANALPAILTVIFIILNIFLGIAGAATSVSIFTIIGVFLLWTCVSVPLVFVGSYFGFRAPKIEVSTRTNQIARFVPEKNAGARSLVILLISGAVPYVNMIVELAIIMNAIWQHHYYYTMGVLFVSIICVSVSCIAVNIVTCYVQLCGEDHRWWWKSFVNGAAAGFYILLHSIWYLSHRLQLVGMLPIIVYITYMTMISICFGLFCGSLSFMSCFLFTRKIYGALKVD